MQSFHISFFRRAALSVAVIGATATLSGQGPVNAAPVPAKTIGVAAAPAAKSVAAAPVTAAAAVAVLKTPAAPALRFEAPAAAVKAAAVTLPQVRSMLKFETVRWGGKPVNTLDEASRILLTKAAAEKAGLRDVGLSFHDVYGVIEAETSWIPRTGASKDGTPNLGLAQFEPRTAKGLGLKDPEDPVQAVFAAAQFMKDAAQWSGKKISHLNLQPEQHAAKLREGVSIYYNLSIKGRNKWNGVNTAELPIETQRHIRNAAAGASEAAQLARLLNA